MGASSSRTRRDNVCHLENVPPEIFNHILYYVFEPTSCKTAETSEKFSSYKFDVSLLCVNKAIHRVARSYLHMCLPWIRVDINWLALLVDPHCLGVPYIPITYKTGPKMIKMYKNQVPYKAQRRSLRQDVPTGRIHVKIEFPPFETEDQRALLQERIVAFGADTMSVLVLEKDFPDFIRVVRLNDLAYCQRVSPGPRGSHFHWSVEELLGMCYKINVGVGLQLAKYRHLLECFRDLHGVNHRCVINGTEDKAHAADIIHSIVHPGDTLVEEYPGMPGTLVPARTTEWELASHLLWLKVRGDGCLQQGHYSNAAMTYIAAYQVEMYWKKNAPWPQHIFFFRQNPFLHALYTALSANMVIAAVYGNLRLPESMYRYNQEMLPVGLADICGHMVPGEGELIILFLLVQQCFKSDDTILDMSLSSSLQEMYEIGQDLDASVSLEWVNSR